jgi:hypothetical protein
VGHDTYLEQYSAYLDSHWVNVMDGQVHIFTVQTIFTVCGSTDDWLKLRQVGKHNRKRKSGRKLMTRIPNRNNFTVFQ